MAKAKKSLLFLLITAQLLASCSHPNITPDPANSRKQESHLANWDGSPLTNTEGRTPPVVGLKGMVVADDRVAAEWGAEILRKGGNAIDAAVATAFAMASTRPHYASLGGGGFLLYCPHPVEGSKKPECKIIDYREEAPGKATQDMYLRNDKPETELSAVGAMASGVPGVTAGLLMALEKFGTLPRQKLLSKPIELAKGGFKMTSYMESAALKYWKDFNDSARIALGCKSSNGKLEPCAPGTLIVQKDLARVLEEISHRGSSGFYKGWVAQKIVGGLKASGGILSLEDLAQYRPRLRKPLYGTYQGHEIVTMPPPSNGGTAILQMLNFAEKADRQGQFDDGFAASQTVHAIAHAMKLAFADRATFFGDPDQVDVPIERLLSPTYLEERWKTFDPKSARAEVGAGELSLNHEGQHTTHFSVIDKDGNAVAVTTTINDAFGSGFVPPGTGIFMNDEMDDFSISPGTANLFGLVGGKANAIAPHKRPVSSMSPTIARDASGNVQLVIGGAGGPRITTGVFLSLLNHFRFGMSFPDAVAAGRFHHQWKPDLLQYEQNFLPKDVLSRLRELGYPLKNPSPMARLYGLERFVNGRVWGAPDPRGEGAAVPE